jgi:hypothetical protein
MGQDATSNAQSWRSCGWRLGAMISQRYFSSTDTDALRRQQGDARTHLLCDV